MEGWPLEAICEHLEAVSYGQIMRLLMNVPPGFMKSLLSNVFWPAWEWGPLGRASYRYLCASYSQALTVRDNMRFRQVVGSDLYRALWGDQFAILSPNIEKVINDKTGWKLATSIKGLGTGERGDRIILDDPNNVQTAESDAERATVNHYFKEVLPTRVNDAKIDPIIVIQQRTHEEDVSGIILAEEHGIEDYEHLMIPMEYDSTRHCVTSIGWQDPRGVDPTTGETLVGAALDAADYTLAWEARFPASYVKKLKSTMGDYAAAGQLQQSPTPRGGGIFQIDWWVRFPPSGWENAQAPGWHGPSGGVPFPPFDFKVASLDTAYTEKEENDFSALTVWGIWRAATIKHIAPKANVIWRGETMILPDDERPKIMLMYGWEKRLVLHGPPEDRPNGVTEKEWNSPYWIEQRKLNWGLVEWTNYAARRYQIDALLIESKAAGITVADELERLYRNTKNYAVHLVSPQGDKVARAYAVQHLFSNGQIHYPMLYDPVMGWFKPTWCSRIIDQMAVFPKTSHDDLTDSATQALKWLRDNGFAVRRDEAQSEFEEEMSYQSARERRPLYET